MEALPTQEDDPQYAPNMLEDVWPPVRLEGEEDDRIQDQDQGEDEDRALARDRALTSQELSQEVNGLLDNLGLGLSLGLAGNQEHLPFSMREEPNISSTRADAAADVVG
jgi:hypothetical protein